MILRLSDCNIGTAHDPNMLSHTPLRNPIFPPLQGDKEWVGFSASCGCEHFTAAGLSVLSILVCKCSCCHDSESQPSFIAWKLEYIMIEPTMMKWLKCETMYQCHVYQRILIKNDTVCCTTVNWYRLFIHDRVQSTCYPWVRVSEERKEKSGTP